MSGSIRLSKQYGVNPSINVCFFCGEDKNELLLLGAFGGKEAPHRAVWNQEPCDACKEHMKSGVILISVRSGSDEKNPYRTGGWCVLREEAVQRLVTDEAVCASILKKRVYFVPDEVWDMVGLPRGPVNSEGTEPV